MASNTAAELKFQAFMSGEYYQPLNFTGDTMKYRDMDYFVGKIPYHALKKQSNATQFLKTELMKIQHYEKALQKYPAIKCEPLDFVYNCLESLSFLDKDTLSDFFGCTWKGVVWGAFLAAVEPSKVYKKILENPPAVHHHNQYITDLALAIIREKIPTELESLHVLIKEFRSRIEKLPKPYVPLRECLSPGAIAELEVERRKIREIYKTEGVGEALERIRNSTYCEWLLGYSEWRRQYPLA